MHFDYTYFGVTFSFNGKFNLAKKRLHDHASKAMYSVVSKCRKLDFPQDICMELFDIMITPILTYGSEVWGYENVSILEKLHLLEIYQNDAKDFKIHPKCHGLWRSKRVKWSCFGTGNSQSKWSQIFYKITLVMGA
jgi:ribosomal protein L32